jgi:4-hydroxy-tetrahydrodipicolinate synthase
MSVAAHLYSPEITALYQALAAGDIQEAGRLQRWLTPRMNALFAYPSPAPVKVVLALDGLVANTTRLPILPLDEAETADILQRLGRD